jgi:hypothetical protein
MLIGWGAVVEPCFASSLFEASPSLITDGRHLEFSLITYIIVLINGSAVKSVLSYIKVNGSESGSVELVVSFSSGLRRKDCLPDDRRARNARVTTLAYSHGIV